MSPLLLLLACSTARTVVIEEPPPLDLEPTVILVSLDGFRWDYQDRADTPTLDRLAAEGVRADALIPAFPSKTFPNHYTIATGLYPEHHGIVDNSFYDPERDAWFSMSDSATVLDGSWWGGEPIWATAERQGQRAGTCFWPGSEAEIAGERPSYYKPYSGGMAWEDRVAQLMTWLELPADERPTFLTLYYNEPDHTGHKYGPDGPEVELAAAEADAGVGLLVDALEERGLLDQVDVLVVSDHGMASMSPERLVFLDEHINADALEVTAWGPYAFLWPEAEQVPTLVEALADLPHASCYAREDVPASLHFTANARIAPLICVAEVGWSLTTRDWASWNQDYYEGATHGWDPAYTEMHGVLLGRGPSLKVGLASPPVRNIDLYSLMTHLLELEPAETDGSLDGVEHLLR